MQILLSLREKPRLLICIQMAQFISLVEVTLYFMNYRVAESTALNIDGHILHFDGSTSLVAK